MTTEDHLDEDKIIKGQSFVCLSLLTPSSFPEASREKHKDQPIMGLKIRGVYETLEEAQNRAAQLQKLDKYHNVFIGEVGKWLPFDVDLSKMQNDNQVYREQELNNYMKAYKDALEEESAEEKKRKEELLKDVKVVKQDNAVVVEEEKTEPVVETEKLNNKEDLTKKLEQSKETLASLEDKINEIKKLSEKLNK